MNQLQSKILEIFKEFDRICRDNDLKYYAIGGTCIGAVRHKGFIPWDDDLDVAMPIEDYNRFRKLAPLSLAPQYQIYDYEEHEKCDFQFLKLFDRNTAFIEEKYKDLPDRYLGVFIDIMPIVRWDDSLVSKYRFILINLYKRLNTFRRFRGWKDLSSKVKLLQYISLPFWIGRPFNHFSLKIEKILLKVNIAGPDFALFFWRKPSRSLFPYQCFQDRQYLPFEDTEMSVPVDYDGYLRKDFGDYMTLPPENRRVSVHPPSVIDLEHSYLDYLSGDKL